MNRRTFFGILASVPLLTQRQLPTYTAGSNHISIGAAVSQLKTGEAICIPAGTYRESIVFNNIVIDNPADTAVIRQKLDEWWTWKFNPKRPFTFTIRDDAS